MVDALTRQNALAAGQPDPLPAAQLIGSGRYPLPLLQAIDAALVVNPERRPQDIAAMAAIFGQAAVDDEVAAWHEAGRFRALDPQPETPQSPSGPNEAQRGGGFPVVQAIVFFACVLILIGTAVWLRASQWHEIPANLVTQQNAAPQQAAEQPGIQPTPSTPPSKVATNAWGGPDLNDDSAWNWQHGIPVAVALRQLDLVEISSFRDWIVARNRAGCFAFTRLQRSTANRGWVLLSVRYVPREIVSIDTDLLDKSPLLCSSTILCSHSSSTTSALWRNPETLRQRSPLSSKLNLPLFTIHGS